MACLAVPVNVRAAGNVHHVEYSALKRGELAEVRHIIDPLTVQLHDGRLVRLSGIEVPDMDVNHPGAYALLARDILTDMLNEQTVQIYQSKNEQGRSNRMGHMLAQLERQSDGLWVQGVLLSLGLARVRTSVFNPEMAAEMLAIEDQARTEDIGIWSEDEHRVLAPDEVEGFENSVRVVEGRVVSTAMRNNQIYINFGSNWRDDFTISIAPEDKRRFSRAGIDPLQWNGKMVRVRGWVDSYNGPYIQIDHPAAVEILEENEE